MSTWLYLFNVATKPSRHVTEEYLHILSSTDELNLCHVCGVYCIVVPHKEAYLSSESIFSTVTERREYPKVLSSNVGIIPWQPYG